MSGTRNDNDPHNPSHGDEIEWTDEDEAAAERAWERLRRQWAKQVNAPTDTKKRRSSPQRKSSGSARKHTT
jgi:hypothetical protein